MVNITIEFYDSAFDHGVNKESMGKMTEQEARELDRILTATDPELGENGTGFLSRRDARIMGLDDLSINYLMTKAEATHKTPACIIGEMVRERIAAVN